MTLYHVSAIFYNVSHVSQYCQVVHFIVQHQFADGAAAGSDRHGVIVPPVTAAPGRPARVTTATAAPRPAGRLVSARQRSTLNQQNTKYFGEFDGKHHGICYEILYNTCIEYSGYHCDDVSCLSDFTIMIFYNVCQHGQ